MPMRRCSAESTQKIPPSDQNAWPPRFCSPSWSTTTARTPRSASSNAATSPASPAPTISTGSGCCGASDMFVSIVTS
ncbi:putative FAD binding domain-containing protein [Rosellinia necatrix]|uniref:Putative FAD binding domain-containing protein n=1 Tax=Rosellinia necatrix TaxID=77044 RepID=A0A1S8A7E3_ROSNE|nr:putative FAD binding domain-containing protein [Rosellinia necatrix]